MFKSACWTPSTFPAFSHVFFPMDPRARPVVQVPLLMAEVDGNPQGQPAPCWPGAEGDLCNGHGTKKVVNRYAEDDFSVYLFLIGKSPVVESMIFYLLGVPQANPGYSDLTVTSMLKATGTRIVKCAMFKTLVKCTVLGSSIYIHRNLFSQFKVLNKKTVLDRNKQLVFKIELHY